jgi:hypothetical protein
MSLATLSSAGLRDKALEECQNSPILARLNKLMASLTDEDISFAELAGIEKDTVLAGSVPRAVNSPRPPSQNSVVAVSVPARQAAQPEQEYVAGLEEPDGAPVWFLAFQPARRGLRHSLTCSPNPLAGEGCVHRRAAAELGSCDRARASGSIRQCLEGVPDRNGGLSDYEEGYIGVTHAELSGEVLSGWPPA